MRDEHIVLLAVDDNPDNLFVVRKLLAGYLPDSEVVTTTRASEGLRLAAERPPDAMLIDVQMPEMGGMEMCRRLKADARTAYIPIVLMTAYTATSRLRAEGLDAGADDFISKPIDNVELMARIKVLLRIKRAEDELREMNVHLEKVIDRRTRDLRASEEALRFTQFAVDHVSDAIFGMGSDARLIYANEAACRMLGYSQEELLSMAVHDIDPGFPVEAWPEHWREVKRRGSFTVESRHLTRDGRAFPVEITANYLEFNGVEYHWAFVRDITERRKAEGSLRESEERFRSTFERAAVGIAHTTQDGGFLLVNQRFCDILGYTQDELRALNVREITYPDDLDMDLENARKLLAGEVSTFSMEKRYLRKDGSVVWVNLTVSLVREPSGDPKYFIGVVEDIAERKQTEERIRFLADIVETSPVSVIATDENTKIIYANLFTEKLFGYEKGELLGIDPAILNADPNADKIQEEMVDTVRQKSVWKGEILNRKKNGDLFYIHASIYQLLDEKGNPTAVVGFQEDITEHKRMDQELIRLERLRALGEMSAGVSHNLNNILTSVLGPAQLLERITDDPQVLREARDIVASTRRARDLVHRLHLATRGVEEDALQSVEVNEVVREAVEVSRPRWKDEPEGKGMRIEVATEFEDIPPVRGTGTRMHDIFVNLLLNAVDAMPEGGRISIRTRSVGEGVEIAVRDTGIGMDEETRRRVFEPFFTTKVDIGTGLGLSTVYNTVVQWGGDIEVESTPGEGTVFTIRLPACTEAEVREEARAEAPRSRRGKLLIVEDDAGVCEFLSRLLEENHEVEAVGDGREAMERFAPGRYDVALIDIGIPGISGDRVAQQMRQADPSLVTVLITGWDLWEGDPRISRFDLRIQKPFDDLDDVDDVVARAMELHDERAERRN